MGRGKHAGDPNSFEDTSSYSYENSTKTEIQENKYDFLKEDENIKEKSTNEFLEGFGHQNEFENDYIDFYGETTINYKKIFLILAIIIILTIGGFFIYKYLSEEKEPELDPEPVETTAYNMIEQIEGYDVLGKIVIEDLNIEQYILDSTEDKALENGIGRLYGETLNNYGNFCIAGHNYEKVFDKLSELKVGDKFVIIDKKLKETEYEIKESYITEPDDLKCLLQDEEKIEITLITCNEGATTRLIVKAEEVNSINSNSSNTNTTNITNTTDNTTLNAKENV